MKIRPIDGNVVVRRSKQEETTKAGIILTAPPAKEMRGVVVAVGAGVPLQDGTIHKPNLKEGEIVVFGNQVASVVKDGEDDLLIMSASNIFAVLD